MEASDMEDSTGETGDGEARDQQNIADRYRRLAGAFTSKVSGVDASRWGDPSPCEDWTARDVVRHLVDTHGMFLGLVDRTLPEAPSVDEAPLQAWTSARDQVQAGLDDPQRAAEEFDGFLGRTTFAGAADRFLCFDLLIHGWDLARATGQDEHLDPADIERARVAAEAFGDGLRGPGVCGPAIEVAPEADEATRLLAFLGRRP